MLTNQTIVRVHTAGGIDERASRVHGVTIRDDGTLWVNNNTLPIVVGTPDMTSEQLKVLVKAKDFHKIPDANFARLGILPNNKGEVLLWDDFKARRDPIEKARYLAEKKAEMTRFSVHLSSRGWGDFSPVQWVGDISTDESAIVADCQALLASEHDADEPSQSDEKILAKVRKAKADFYAKRKADTEIYEKAKEVIANTPDGVKNAYQQAKGNPDNLADDIDHPNYWALAQYDHALEIVSIYESKHLVD